MLPTSSTLASLPSVPVTPDTSLVVLPTTLPVAKFNVVRPIVRPVVPTPSVTLPITPTVRSTLPITPTVRSTLPITPTVRSTLPITPTVRSTPSVVLPTLPITPTVRPTPSVVLPITSRKTNRMLLPPAPTVGKSQSVIVLPVTTPPPVLIPTPLFKISTPGKKTLILLEGQDIHAATLERALLSTSRAMDVSEMGDGKTYTTCYLAQKHGWNLFVVAPLTICSAKWNVVPNEYNIPSISYGYSKAPNGFQGLLTKHKVDDKVTHYTANPELLEKINSNTLLVFDEMHHLKNPGTSTLKACAEIARVTIARGGKIIGLSATPMASPKHAAPMFRAFGIMTREKPYLYDYSAKEFIPDGILEIEALARSINREALKEVQPDTISARTIGKYVQDILYKVVLPVIRSRFVEPAGSKAKNKKNMKNLFMKMDDSNMAILQSKIKSLEALTRSNMDKGVAGANFGQVTTTLKEIELCKMPLFIKAIKHALSKPNTKVIVGVNYLDSMDIIADHFAPKGDEDAMCDFLTGEYTMAERKETIDGFHNDPTLRILLSSPKVGGEGIDLHATDGITQIYQFLNSSYDHTSLIQFAGRAHRKGQTSKPVIRVIYVDSCIEGDKVQRELHLMDSLNSKSANMAAAKGVDIDECPMPGNLESEYEVEFFSK